MRLNIELSFQILIPVVRPVPAVLGGGRVQTPLVCPYQEEDVEW